MTEEAKQKPPRLEGEAALNLWRQGRDAWNRWIDQHPGWDINFAFVNFSTKRAANVTPSFARYHFGDGNVDFSFANFGDGTADFSYADFGDCNVKFFGANFSANIVSFSRATFGDGDVDFGAAIFGDGYVDFSETTFGNGNIDFSSATFGDGAVNFEKATFGHGTLNFSSTTFGKNRLDFSSTTFGDSNIVFHQAKLNELTFSPVAIGSSHIKAQDLSIKRQVVFNLPSTAVSLKSFDLHGASFDGPLTLEGNIGIVPDLQATRSSHQVELSALNIELPRVWQGFGWPPKLSSVAEHPEDAARLRRIKEIAETNKDHQAALRFSADENRARRWTETSWFGSILDMAFSACSNYGQSILRPFVGLFVLAVASMGLYKKLAVTTEIEWWTGPGWGQSLLLSISNSLPFLPQSRGLREDALKALYPGDPGFWTDALMIGQGVFSFAFLFLIGLGLRNRFRL